MPVDPNKALRPLVNGWLKKIKLAEDLKRTEFGTDAAECMRFFNGPYNWLYNRRNKSDRETAFDYEPDENGEDVPPPTFRMTVNKAAEVVQLFGPVMYQRNPDRRVNPRKSFRVPLEYFGDPNDPMVQQQALQFLSVANQERGKDLTISRLFEDYLNYTPEENNLRRESRLVVDEALIKGLSGWWIEAVEMPNGLHTVGSFYDTVDNLLLDPDAKRIEDCQWIARRCVHPVWAVEREYGLPPGSLKGNKESASSQAETQDPQQNYDRVQGTTNDLLVYWKIYSKMGLGARLKGMMDSWQGWKDVLEGAGDYCYLAVCNTCDYPLNLPPTIDGTSSEALQQACQWPVPFWLDKGGWPFQPLAFHWVPNQLWPMAHLKPALGELKFINWVFSFLCGKVRTASRDFLVMLKSQSDEVKRAIKHGPDMSVIEVEQLQGDIDKIVKFIQHPGFNPEIYTVLERVMELFDKRTGLTDLIYGQTATQLRSAQEANVKQQNANIRPDDMAQQVEDAASELSRKEMAACRWLLTDKDVSPVLGTIGAYLWQTEVMQLPPETLFHQYECKVEAGSTKRPNKQANADNLKDALNNLFSPLFQYASQTGDVNPVNALVGDWATSIGMDAEKYLLKPPPPPPPPGAAGGPPGGGPPPQGPPPGKQAA